MRTVIVRLTLLGSVSPLSPVAALLLAASPAPPLVIGADGVLCDLTRTLARDQARVECLIPAGSDPHTLSLRPSDRRNLAQASLVLINGYNLSPSLNSIQSRGPVVAVAEQAVPGSPARDPHVWHDPANTAAMAGVVAARLQVLTGSGNVQRRKSAAVAVLKDLGAWSGRQIQTVPSKHRVLVTEHRAFSPFARRYGVRELPVLDDYATGGVLRPSSLRAITKAIGPSGTKAIFAEALPPSKTLRRISRSSGVPIAPSPLFADGLAPNRSLIQTATANVCTFVKAQGGRCDSAGATALQKRWAAIR